MRRTLYVLLALAIAVPLVATAWAGVRPKSGFFVTKNGKPPVTIIVQGDRKNANVSGGCPGNPEKQKFRFPGVDTKIRHGKIKFDRKTKVISTATGKSTGKARVTFHAEFVTKKKATGAYHIYKKGCSKLAFTATLTSAAG
jgi:hypothetical protein